MTLRARWAVFAAVVCALGAASAARGQSPTEDFSETRLREGKEAYEAGRYVDAVSNLRIAAFGFLGRPTLLCESLILLAVAEDAAERPAEALATVDRVLEVQRAMPACADAKVSPSVRKTFETKFRQRLPGSVPAADPRGTPSPRAPASNPTPRRKD